ncbi:MAG: DUF3617 family protein [Deltaproteobacteria bacterium]|nr:DUF3617 family protein [Deltaproteobacteria bacterium]
MAKKIFYMIFVSSVIVSFGTAFAGPNMDPGKWEITTKTEMAGMPPQSVTHEQCITNNDLVPVSGDANQECQVEDTQINGDTVSWKITCGGQGGGMTGTGKITYNGDSMNGEMNMTIAPYGTQVKNTISGRRIGDCEASAPDAQARSSAPASGESGNVVKEAIAEDARDVGQAARDEAKEATKEGVREGVRGIFKGIFK